MKLVQLSVNEIKPNPFQPRMKFDKDELQELADNISKHGLIEPIVVTKRGGKFMIVAGERRWRANKLAKQKKVWSLIKIYDSDSDIKRDSLVENEMRENLNTEEFKSFVFSLAKSLGKPYYNKGFIDAVKLTEYVVGGNSKGSTCRPFYLRLNGILNVESRGSAKVKKLVSEQKLDLFTAERISSIPDKATQNELVEMAKVKTVQEIRQEVGKHNLRQDARAIVDKPQKDIVTESKFLTKFYHKVRDGNDKLNSFVDILKTVNNQKFVNRLMGSSRLEMLDELKPLRRDLERALHIVDKIMGRLAK